MMACSFYLQLRKGWGLPVAFATHCPHCNARGLADDLTMLAVEASLQGGMEGLRAFLHSRETGAPMLFIDALSVKSAAEKVVGRAAVLDFSLKVRGNGR
jgi:hypothetical protein